MELEPKKFYRFLSPRPAILLTTVDLEKNVNAAPFSFVMPVSVNPPLLAVSMGAEQNTLSDIRATREFVVNVPSETILDRFWACSQQHPPGTDPLSLAGLTQVPSSKVLAPSVAECIVCFECFLDFEKQMGDHVLIVGSVVNLRVKDEVVGKDGNIDMKKAASLMHISGQKFTVAERELASQAFGQYEMKQRPKALAVFSSCLLILLLFAGCANQPAENNNVSSTSAISTTQEAVTTTSSASSTTLSKESTAPDTSLPANKGLNESCALNSDCATSCCAYLNGKHKCADAETCKPKKTTQEECYAKSWYWCAGECQKTVCDDCTKYTRCVTSNDSGKNQAMIESAKMDPSREGSCIYSGEYTAAGGEKGFCGLHKGQMIYAKCGSPPDSKDCSAAYGDPGGYTYMIPNQRAFHAPDGEEYDLFCFYCERVG